MKTAAPKRAMIGNLFFLAEVIVIRKTNSRIYMRRADSGAEISFERKDIGTTVFIQYF